MSLNLFSKCAPSQPSRRLERATMSEKLRDKPIHVAPELLCLQVWLIFSRKGQQVSSPQSRRGGSFTRSLLATRQSFAMTCKQMLLLSFLSLFLLSALTEGRRIGAEMKSKGNEEKVEPQVEQTEQQVRVGEERELGEVESEGSDEVPVDMDYKPASRKSPVHN